MILPFLYFLIIFVSKTITQRRQVSERPYTRQKEVSAGSDRGESWQALDLFPNGPLWDGHVKSAVLCTENRVALVSQLVKVWVVRPHVHRKFKLADEARTAHERGDASLCAVVGDTFRQRRTISPPAPDHLPPVHVHCGIARVHAPDVRTERTAIAVRVHLCVIEIIVALRISTELWIVLIGREDKRSAAPLVLAPDKDDPKLGADSQRNNDFNYAKMDPHGYGCPLGAHIRRMNPRDTAVNMNRRKMIRRGGTYGPPLPEGVPDDGTERGIAAFVGCASLVRQFEFAMNVWANDPNFHELGNERDPIFGTQDGTFDMTIPKRPIRKKIKGLPAFTTIRGGAYFFLPGIKALRYLASLT